MTQRFDIEVRDLVAKSIRSEIKSIGDEARTTAAMLKAMKAEMASGAGGGIAASARADAAAINAATTASGARATQARDTAAAIAAEGAATTQATSATAQFSAVTATGVSNQLAFGNGMRRVSSDVLNGAAQLRTYSTQLRTTTSAQKEFTNSAGQMRMGQMMLGQQIQDIGMQLSLGTDPLRVMAMQAGQTALAVQQMGGKMAGAARFIGSAWGSTLLAGASILALLISSMSRADSELSEHEQELRRNISATDALGQAQGALGHMFDMSTGKLMHNSEALRLNTIQLALNMRAQAQAQMMRSDAVLAGAERQPRQLEALGIGGHPGQIATLVRDIAGSRQSREVRMTRLANLETSARAQGYESGVLNYIAGVRAAINDGVQGREALRIGDETLRSVQSGVLDPNLRRSGGGNRGRHGREGVNRAQELADVNRELDQQLRLTTMYGPELERETQFLQIQNALHEKHIELSRPEEAAIRGRIAAIQDGQRVQEAMNAIDQEANSATRTYEDTVSALNIMLGKNQISQEEQTRQLSMATRAYEDAHNPLAELNRELQRNGELMGLYGRDRDVASYIQRLQQAAEAKGQSIYRPGSSTVGPDGTMIVQGHSRGYTDEVRGMIDEFRRQQQQDRMQRAIGATDPREHEDVTSGSFILDHHREMYAEIQRLREQDVINEEEANRRKENLDRAYTGARLEAMSSLFGQLSSLQNSENRKVAAIGKAAAIAQATIDGYRAVQAALAGPPGPPWSFAIAGVTGAMTAMNVARIAGVGFQSGGFTGSGADHDRAGDVHRNEYVFDAAATRRIGVPALEAMRRGTLSGGPQNDNHRGPMVVVRPMPGVFVEERRTPTGEIELIAKRMVAEHAPQVVADDMRGNPNGKVSRATQDSFGVRRNR